MQIRFVAVGILMLGAHDYATAANLEREAIQYREQIIQSAISIDMSYQLHSTVSQSLDSELQIWMTSENHRMDWTRPCTNVTQEGSGVCRYSRIWTPSEFISATFVPDETTHGKSLVIEPPKTDTPGSGQEEPFVDPRVVGMCPVSVMNTSHYHLESFLDRPDATAVSQSEETVDGIPCVRIDRELNDGTSTRTWIATERGPSVVKMEWEFPGSNDSTSISRIDVSLEQFGKDRFWYPASIKFVQKDNQQVVQSEDANLTVASINEPLSSSIFTVGGLDIPVGKKVLDLRKPSEYLVWDGNEVLPASEVDQFDYFASTSILLVVAIGLALLSAVAAWKLLR